MIVRRARALLALGVGAAGCGVDALLLSEGPSSAIDPATDAGPSVPVDVRAAEDSASSDAPIEAGPPIDRGDVTALSAGQSFACAEVKGATTCWGANGSGELGTGDLAARLDATPLASPLGFTTIAAGDAHTCAIAFGARDVWCWGNNDHGQLGVGDTQSRLTPVRAALSAPAKALGSGYEHVCAILDDGSLWCWGDGGEGQLGLGGGSTPVSVPARVGTKSDWMAVAGGQGHTCGLRAPGALWCWGRDTAGELGLGDDAPIQVQVPVQVGADVTYASLDLGQDEACALRVDGTAWCWGANSFAQVARVDASVITSPTLVESDAGWASVSTDTFVTCGVRLDGTLWCWGRNAEGQLGLGDNLDRPLPTQVGTDATWSRASVGRFHTCAQKTDGSAWCAGDNSVGQLGVGDTNRRSVFTRVALP